MLKYGVALSLVFLGFCIAGCSSQPEATYSGDPKQDIMAAVETGDAGKIKELAARDASVLQLTDAEGMTLLHFAVLRDQPASVRALIEAGMDPNVKDNRGLTPLGELEDHNYRFENTRRTLADLGGVS